MNNRIFKQFFLRFLNAFNQEPFSIWFIHSIPHLHLNQSLQIIGENTFHRAVLSFKLKPFTVELQAECKIPARKSNAVYSSRATNSRYSASGNSGWMTAKTACNASAGALALSVRSSSVFSGNDCAGTMYFKDCNTT